MSDETPCWEELISGLREGDPRMSAWIYQRYGPLMERLADKNLVGALRRRVGPEDVAGSACRTFLRRIQDGQFELDSGQRLWSLLCAITLAKTRKHARYHLRQKRGVGSESSVAGPAGDDGPHRFEAPHSAPGPAEAAEFADQFRHLMDTLDEEEKQIVLLRVQQLTNEEVAERVGCSERTVRRILQRIQSRLSHEFEEA